MLKRYTGLKVGIKTLLTNGWLLLAVVPTVLSGRANGGLTLYYVLSYW